VVYQLYAKRAAPKRKMLVVSELKPFLKKGAK